MTNIESKTSITIMNHIMHVCVNDMIIALTGCPSTKAKPLNLTPYCYLLIVWSFRVSQDFTDLWNIKRGAFSPTLQWILRKRYIYRSVPWTRARSAEKYRLSRTNQSNICTAHFDHCHDLQGRIVNKSSNIIKYSPEDGHQWWSLWRFGRKWHSTVKWIQCALMLHHNAIILLPWWYITSTWITGCDWWLTCIPIDHYGYVTCLMGM